MGYLSPSELTKAACHLFAEKTKKKTADLFLLAMLAGALIALGSAATQTAVHALDNVGLSRTICGLLFPFGLCMVIAIGAELFTGNSLILIPVFARRATLGGMLRNWAIVYLGNFVGAALVAFLCVSSGQMDASGGQLAVYAIRTAVGKCTLSFSDSVGLGVLCNLLVCMGVLMSMATKDFAGRMIGAFIPVSFFVICGFEHCVANMYAVSAGLLAAATPAYAALATQAGIDFSALTLKNFLLGNLLPVTLGNVLGGTLLGALMSFVHLRKDAA